VSSAADNYCPPPPNYLPMMQAMVEGLQDHARRLERENRELRQENARLRKQVEELKAGLRAGPPPPPPPPFVKPPAPRNKKPGKPGRRPGHPAALRPPPAKIDRTVPVPLGGGRGGACECPDCRGELEDFQDHERLVEDIIPAKVVTTCYQTRSGYCKRCRRRVESRHPEQPPAGFKGQQKHAQLGLNALAWAAVLRVENRAGALSEQAKRLAGWLSAEYERIKLSLRASGVVHCDETGARIEGKNAVLWGLCSDAHTLYHFDPTRAGRVVRQLLASAVSSAERGRRSGAGWSATITPPTPTCPTSSRSAWCTCSGSCATPPGRTRPSPEAASAGGCGGC
jgi:transposase